MGKIKIEAIIEYDDEFYPNENSLQSEMEWFINVLNDKENTMLMLWSNDIGDEIGNTKSFKWELLTPKP